MTPRLLRTPPLTGAENMALDEVLLRRAAESAPVVRLYTWRPATVTLGYAQPVAAVDREAIARHGLDLTRRLTGGRAVLHADELTYSVIVGADTLGTARSISRAYGLISGALAEALDRVGVPAACQPRKRAEAGSAPAPGDLDRDPACFAATIGGDLAVGERKLVGSAQCQRHGGILQHGSIPITVDEALLAEVLRRPAGAGRDWTCLAELGLEPDPERFAEALADGFATLFGARPQPTEPTPAEWAAMHTLAEHYASEAWIARC